MLQNQIQERKTTKNVVHNGFFHNHYRKFSSQNAGDDWVGTESAELSWVLLWADGFREHGGELSANLASRLFHVGSSVRRTAQCGIS